MFCCTLLYVHSSIVIILMGKRELVALLNLSSWCLVMVERLFLAVPLGCLRFVIVVFPDHTHLLFLISELVLILVSFLVFLCNTIMTGKTSKIISEYDQEIPQSQTADNPVAPRDTRKTN